MEWEDLKRKLMKNPEFRREWEASEPEYQLARELIIRRMQKGLSQSQLANKIGTKQPVISRLESGNARPSLTLLDRVAEALDARVVVRLEPITKRRARPAAKKRPRARPRKAS